MPAKYRAYFTPGLLDFLFMASLLWVSDEFLFLASLLWVADEFLFITSLLWVAD